MAESYFVGIYDPIDVRRNILESSKEIVKSLQSFEKIESIREEKLKTIKDMKKIMAELELLISKLADKLPKTKLRKAIEKTADNLQKNTAPTPGRFSSELEKLESQLRLVEKELSSFK